MRRANLFLYVVFAAVLLVDFFLCAGHPWMLLLGQASLAITTALAVTLLGEWEQKTLPLAPANSRSPFQTVSVISEVKTVVVEKKVPDLERLQQLNAIRPALWEKEILIGHLLEEKKKSEDLLHEQQQKIIDLQKHIDHHPSQIAYRELRKQFSEKGEAFHQLRKQLFALEGELIVLQREKALLEEAAVEQSSQYIQSVAEAEKGIEKQEEHIMRLEQLVKRSQPRRTVRRKKAKAQGELLDLLVH